MKTQSGTVLNSLGVVLVCFAFGASASAINIPISNKVKNGGFETGGIPNTFWNPETSTNFGTPLCDVPSCGTGGGASPPRTGAFWLWFGGIPAPETATLGQTVTIPAASTATLRFWMRVGTVSSPFTDVVNVRVDGGPWVVPAGTAAVEDDYGGVAGVLTLF